MAIQPVSSLMHSPLIRSIEKGFLLFGIVKIICGIGLVIAGYMQSNEKMKIVGLILLCLGTGFFGVGGALALRFRKIALPRLYVPIENGVSERTFYYQKK